MVLLFKPEHVGPIQDGKKTMTRRTGKKRWNEGAIHKAKTKMLSKDYFSRLEILSVHKERLGDITLEDVKKEGYNTLKEFKSIWIHINKIWDPDLEVWVIEFRQVPDNLLKAGDRVVIHGSAEARKYAGHVWEVIEEPRRLRSGAEVVRIRRITHEPPLMEESKDLRNYYSMYFTEYLIKINQVKPGARGPVRHG